jgi:hypothetical protein
MPSSREFAMRLNTTPFDNVFLAFEEASTKTVNPLKKVKVCYGRDPSRVYYVFLFKNPDRIDGYKSSWYVVGWYHDGEKAGQIFGKPQLLLRERLVRSNKIYSASVE